MHRRWLSLPLLSSCVNAFYPYTPTEGGDSKGKRFIPFNPHVSSSDNSGVVTLDLQKVRTSKRDNNYNVVKSGNPSLPNSMAIHQDGRDYTYFSTVTFGSPGQEMYMLIDSGSANTWVMGSNCDSAACQIHTTLGPSDSDSLRTTSQTWSLAYGTGHAGGVVATDSVSFAGYTVEMGFGLATSTSDDFKNYPMDGILGLGRANSESLGVQTIMEVLDEQAGLKENIIGLHLQRAEDETKDGQITFGGVDESRFSGKLSYTRTANDDHWEIAADDAGVGGKGVGFKGKTAIIDTGTSYILMPPSDAQALHDLIPGSDHNGEVYTVPCSTDATVYFTFSGVKYAISPKDYVGTAVGSICSSNIIGHQAFGPDQWILGDVFLKNVYTVLDFDNTRIGFGTISGKDSPSTSSAPQSAATSSTQSAGVSATGTLSPDASALSTASSSQTSDAAATATISPGDSSPFGASAACREGVQFFSAMAIAFVAGLFLC